MKKFILVSLSVLAAVLVLLISMVRFSRQQYSTDFQYYEGSISTESAKINEYYLPYPGVLPDHPLYFMKMFRDRVKLVFVSDEVEKIELLLFYADKRIGAAEVLLRGNKISLAEVTAHKAELYMGQAMEILREFDKEKKRENMDLWWKYYRSISAHKKLLGEMSLMVEGDARVSIEKVIKECEVYREETMGELMIEESAIDEDEPGIDESIDGELLDVEKGFL